jgi:cytochrome c peroxidase
VDRLISGAATLVGVDFWRSAARGQVVLSSVYRRKMMRRVLVLLTTAVLLTAWAAAQAKKPAQEKWPEIERYEPMQYPADNPMSREKVELGKWLYYDKRLSGDGSRSCYSCHLKEKGLTDGLPKAVGAYEAKLPRSSPTMWNIGYHKEFYWDGRSASLEAQCMAAWTGGNMGVTGRDGRPSTKDIAAKLNGIAGYQQMFQKVFREDATPENVCKAISAFERTIVAQDSAWNRFKNGNEKALSPQARRGWIVFSEKAKCTNCHDGALLTDFQYHNVGVGMEGDKAADGGRFNKTKEEKDTGAFKTPTLLDVARSAPYFHDGSKATLEEAVDFMLNGGQKNKYHDSKNLEPRKVTAQERADLLAFLRSLTVNYNVTEPKLP